MNKTRKVLVAFVFILAFILAVPAMGQASGDIRVTVDGVQVVFADKNPVIVEDRTLVHVRGVFEHLGFVVSWDDALRQVTLTNPNYHIIITIGSNSFTTNARTHSLPVPAQIINDFTMLPIGPVMQSMDFGVTWNDSTRTVVITSPVAEVPPPQLPVEDPQEPEYEQPQEEEPEDAAPAEEGEEYPEDEDEEEKEEEKEHPEYVTIRGVRIPTNQVVLYLESMWLTDEEVAPLRYMTHLRELNLGDNWITDVSFLEGVETLQVLRLNNNSIGDLSPLAELPNLWHLDVSYNRYIWSYEPVRHIADLIGDIWW